MKKLKKRIIINKNTIERFGSCSSFHCYCYCVSAWGGTQTGTNSDNYIAALKSN